MGKKNTQSSEGPLSEATFYILLCLSPAPRHGYAIMKDVRHLSQGRVTLSTGTLYGALKRLLEQGWIERLDESEANGSGRIRKAYRLTPTGSRLLKAEIQRLKSIVHAADRLVAGD